MTPSKQIAIIGAGAAGLAAAWDLARAGHRVNVYEAGAEIGGLAAGFKADHWDWTLEKFYHHWFETDQDILDLIAEIGHSDKVLFPWPSTSIWSENGNIPADRERIGGALISRIFNVLGMTNIPFIDRLRFGAAAFALTKYHNGIALESVTADAWLRKWAGKRAYEMMWRPLLIGKFGEKYDQVNMAWMWARLYKRTAKLGTYQGGFQAMLEDLATAVRAQGVMIHLNTPVHSMVPAAEGGLNITINGESQHVDQVLSTVGPGIMLKIAPELPEDYAEKIRKLDSMGAVVLAVSLDRQLMTDGTYWLNLPASSPNKDDNPFPFLALVEHTNYVSPENFGGDHIVYLGDYIPTDHAYLTMDVDAIAERFLPSLTKVNPAFDRSWIRQMWLSKAPYAQPVPYVNHSAAIPAIKTPLEGLYWASMSQVYPWDRGTNYAVEIGRRTARMMLAQD